MAITTQSTVDITYNSETVNTYGLSDTLDNYTIDDILNYVYCSATHRGLYGFYGYAENANIMDYNSILPFSVIKGNSGRIVLDVPRGSSLPYPNGAYMYVVWLKRVSGTVNQIITTSDISHYKMITEMPSNKMLFELPNPSGTKDSVTTWTGGTGAECYATGSNRGSLSYVHRVGNTDNLISLDDIEPYMLIKHDNTVFFWRMNMESMRFWCRPFGHGVYGVMYVGGKVHTAYNNVKYSAVGNNMLTLGNPNVLPYEWGTGTGSSTSGNPKKWGTCAGDNIVYAVGGGNQGDVLGTFRLEFSINTKDKALLFWAACGVYFKAGDKTYKPIISGGYVTGYTDDLSKPSDIDNWEGTTKHTVPTNPPVPSGGSDKDNEKDMNTVTATGSAGMVTYYEINKTGTATASKIGDALSKFDITQIGKDLLRNLISFKAFAVLPVATHLLNIIHIGGKDLKDSDDNDLWGDTVLTLSNISLGSITIPHFYSDFRDFAPYTKIEMYVPFCGWFTLPSWVMGKTVSGEMWVDLYNGTVKAVIKASRTVIAEVGGCCAYDIPFVAESTGTKAGAVISSALATAGMTAATIATPNIATATAAIASATNLACALNSNVTALKGCLGDGSNLNGLNQVWIKVTRPRTPSGDKSIPNSYRHEYGSPCGKEVTLASGQGYTQIIDAKVEGTMTDREKQMIIDGFRHGLIL